VKICAKNKRVPPFFFLGGGGKDTKEFLVALISSEE
jgi:hypothetical protein